MLEAFIIDELRRREQRDDRIQPHLESPFAPNQPYGHPTEPPRSERPSRWEIDDRTSSDDDEDNHNGVIIIDM